METPKFLNPDVRLDGIEELKGEPPYFQNIKELSGKGKLVKKIK